MTWEFNADVAKTFVEHARQHIPNYDQVIDKCVDLCEYCLEENSPIIDVGCATGETIRRLSVAGFSNLTGVEASHAMLKHCNYDVARYIHTDRFPEETFDAVLCNWTLHFIKDKVKYLLDIKQNLQPGGIFVLSEKTSIDPVAINFYHKWKHSQGVSWEDILAKEQAVKDIMHINSTQWYLDTLDSIGFKSIQIIDASWCFTTFLCKHD
ncbi:SmtA SAM-dependent methyltransferases [uncultured Caudovirales phage]|uniref:SmtA SAM-dependent methyltransferases n=1 Tax=uncultured Caudovirales phage TaxID=2100421 RepID=A0A6J5L8Y7_9CAUD|nr:SmtA SAM-dependent methyltransferases [uncultured Caudovirales phage]